ncbi:hypothetical protein QVN49_00240 [Megasphaera hexanoica]|nr:hypothetical protein [Megasphaera hexanoica]
MVKRIVFLCCAFFLMVSGICFARTSVTINKNEGYSPYNGWVMADMILENGLVSKNAAYSMRVFKDFGLIPVAYCSSGGSHLGSYVIFYVNPYNNCLIVGKGGMASHGDIYSSDLNPFKYTGNFVYGTDLVEYKDLYRKVIDTAKQEFYKYQKQNSRLEETK